MDAKKVGGKEIKVEVVFAKDSAEELSDCLIKLIEKRTESLLVVLEKNRKE